MSRVVDLAERSRRRRLDDSIREVRVLLAELDRGDVDVHTFGFELFRLAAAVMRAVNPVRQQPTTQRRAAR